MKKRSVIISSLIIIALLLGYFTLRNSILQKAFRSAQQSIQLKYQLTIDYSDVHFSGLYSISINKLNVHSLSDTILNADTIVITPRLLPLLWGQKQIAVLKLFGANIKANYELIKLFRHKSDTTNTSSEPSSYAKLFNKIQNKAFRYIPNQLEINNSGFTYRNDSVFTHIFLNHFQYKGRKFEGNVKCSDNVYTQQFKLKGELDRGDHQIDATITQTDTALVKIPYIGARWDALVGFDTLHLSVKFNDPNDNLSSIEGQAEVSRFTLRHKRIGPDKVITHSGKINFKTFVGNRYVELDSSTVITINQFSFSPYFRFEKSTHRKLTFEFLRKQFDAQQLFSSLPTGLFTNFDSIKTEGELTYHLKTQIDFDNPDSLTFDSKLENNGFRIVKYGVSDFRRINGAFVHDVYENDRFVKSILVSPENPDFVSVDAVSPYFKSSVLTSEDGDFFYHKGFNADAFRESIVTNLKENRFARGGSTISMQLVKNVFLSRKKTVSRKIEEALIVWTIENLHLVSKQRMFEVYLNIIELGPYVYGIKPAAWFYFHKQPSQLNLAECIWLSSIIPRPKGFKYTFEKNGELRSYLANYYRLMGDKMTRHGQILPADTLNLRPKIKLIGEARNFLSKPDTTIKADSLFYFNDIK